MRMRYLLTVILLAWLPVLAWAAFAVNGVDDPAGVHGVAQPASVNQVPSNYGSGTTAVSQHNLDDNTAGTTVAAAVGSAGTLVGASNTSDVHSATAIEGSGSFLLPAGGAVTVPLTASWFTDDEFSVQWAIFGDQTGPGGSYCRFFDDNTQIDIRRDSDTQIRIALNGTYIYAAGLPDIDDGQWQTFRLVCNAAGIDGGSDTVRLYQRTGTGSWVLEYNASTAWDITAVGATGYFYNRAALDMGWGNGSGNLADQVVIWDGEQLP